MTERPALLVLTNASAGSADDGAVGTALNELRAGADTEVVVLDGPDHTREALRRAPGRRIVVMGGDGSVHACLDALVRTRRPATAADVAVVPLGTGNDLARSLGIPLEPAAAARVALSGSAQPMDLLLDDRGDVVVNAVHCGVGAEATARAEGVKGTLGIAGYALGALRAGVSATGWSLRVTVDGDVVHDGHDRLLMVTVGLGRTIGGGTQAIPAARPGDGLADVVLAASTGPVARTVFALEMRHGRHVQRADVRTVRGREIVVEAVDQDNAFRVNADGEVAEVPVLARSWVVQPQRWTCRVPAGGDRPAR